MKKKRVDRTILIWDQLGEEPLKFAVLDGDYTKFNIIYINSVTEEDHEMSLQNELSNMVYGANGNTVIKFLSKFPLKAARLPFTRVIVAGFLP